MSGRYQETGRVKSPQPPTRPAPFINETMEHGKRSIYREAQLICRAGNQTVITFHLENL